MIDLYTRVRFTKSFKKFYETFYDVAIFRQSLSAVWLKRLRDNRDVIDIFVEFINTFRESYSDLDI